MFRLKKNINRCVPFLMSIALTACYPDTLRQQLAGIDTIEIVFYDKTAQLQDTLVIASKGQIKKILQHCSQEKYNVSPCLVQTKCRKYGKMLFKKQRQKLLIMEATLYFDGRLAYISYALHQKILYRTLEREQIEFFEFARHYKEFYNTLY